VKEPHQERQTVNSGDGARSYTAGCRHPNLPRSLHYFGCLSRHVRRFAKDVNTIGRRGQIFARASDEITQEDESLQAQQS
jgi:hypothetical protein